MLSVGPVRMLSARAFAMLQSKVRSVELASLVSDEDER